jgi:hypothetical protein
MCGVCERRHPPTLPIFGFSTSRRFGVPCKTAAELDRSREVLQGGLQRDHRRVQDLEILVEVEHRLSLTLPPDRADSSSS